MAAEAQMNPDKSVQIVLIGASGSGKSSSGNTILGKKLFKTEASGKSVTVSCESKSESINGWKVTVVDTPGWDCTELLEPEVKSQISQTLQCLQEPYSFLLVLCVGAVESNDIRKIYGLQNCLGRSYFDHTTILFSHSDDLEFKTFEEFLSEGDEEFKELLRKCSNRCYFWNNRDERSDKDVEKILQDLKKTETEEISFLNKMPRMDEEPSSSLMDSDDKGNDVTAETKSQESVTMDAQISSQNIRVLFLGMTKVGKTSSIKTLVGKCDENAGALNYTCPKSGLNLELIESPGFDDNPEQIQKAISKSLSDCAPGPHVIILVMSIGRFSPAIKRIMKHVQDSLGGNGSKHTMILFTREDDLEGKHITTYINENQDLSELVKFCGSKFHAFNNRNISDRIQVEELLQKISEIYKRNTGGFYTIEERHPDSNRHEGKVRQNFLTFHHCVALAEEAQMMTPDKSVQIVLIGASGSGKSSSGNTILGKKLFKTEASAKSVTVSCECKTEFINGWKVTVVDTPGWDCTELPESEVSSQISQTLQCLQEPYSFLLVLRVASMESKDIHKIYGLHKLLGHSYFDHTTILFSHSDDLTGKTSEEFLSEGDEEFQELLRKCNNRCYFWNNRDKRSDKDVEKILQDLKKTETEFKGFRNKMPRMDEEPSPSFINCDEKGNDLTTTRTSQEPITMDAQTSSQNIRVLFLGMSKVGKTSSIKTLVGKHGGNAGALNYTCPKSGLSLNLIESPGFDDSPEQIQKAISKSLSDCAPGPHVIILVMSIGRFSPATKRIMKHVQDSLGGNGSKHTMILFTGKDDLEGKPITTYINDNQDLAELVKFCESKFQAFNNRNISDRTQVEELLQKISEIYERNQREPYTNEGRNPDSNQHKGKESQKRSACPCILW